MPKIPVTKPPLGQLIKGLSAEQFHKLLAADKPTDEKGRYLHWDEFRHKVPPEGKTIDFWWIETKVARQRIVKVLPYLDTKGVPFTYCVPDPLQLKLHLLDRKLAEPPVESAPDEDERTTLIIRALFEEAITSSQLEGAATTRDVAKKILSEGLTPKDKSERMIVNNYRALEFIRDNCREPLTPSMVFELHRIVTEGTLDDPGMAGRFRRDEDNIAVQDRLDGTLLHRPPPADQLHKRLEALCAFANAEVNAELFVHPLVKAILVHFMAAYDHPFVDGNGRTARALFYWCAMQDYRLMEYLSISEVIKRARSRYDKAFLFVETDENDTTYFLANQLETLEKAWGLFEERVRERTEQARNIAALLGGLAENFNHRQRGLLAHAARHPGFIYTIEGHQRTHGIHRNSAADDLTVSLRVDFLRKGKGAGSAFSSRPMTLPRG